MIELIAYKGVMSKWFAATPAGTATCLPMILSVFSHHSAWHLGKGIVSRNVLEEPSLSLAVYLPVFETYEV